MITYDLWGLFFCDRRIRQTNSCGLPLLHQQEYSIFKPSGFSFSHARELIFLLCKLFVVYLHCRLTCTHLSHKTWASPSIYDFHVGHYSLPFMYAPQNSFLQLSLTFSSASAISFSRINPGHWSNFESLQFIDLAHIFPPQNCIFAPRFPHQQFPTIDIHQAFSWPLIWGKMQIAECGFLNFPKYVFMICIVVFPHQLFQTVDLLRDSHSLSISKLRDPRCQLSTFSFLQTPFRNLLSTIFFRTVDLLRSLSRP